MSSRPTVSNRRAAPARQPHPAAVLPPTTTPAAALPDAQRAAEIEYASWLQRLRGSAA